MRKKKWLSVLILAMSFGGIVGAEPFVEVNGTKIDTDAVIINDRTYVPLRGVFEQTGAVVSWDEDTQTAKIQTTENASDDTLIPGIIEKVSPSVVGIIGRAEIESYYGTSDGIVHGSGIIIKSGGEILTNAHVVADMKLILVVMNDGKGYEAKLKYIDEETDLAVVKIKKIGLPVAEFAKTEDIVVGKKVIAIGTPIKFSLRNSATIGYISGTNRGGGEYNLIQTDAAINPGNSGGALVDMDGKVIGITSEGYLGLNINFAIPVDTVQYVLNHFDTYGKVKRATLGATFKEDWLASLGVPSDSGLPIKSIEKDSPLAAAGYKAGNTLTSIDGTAINSIVELNEKLKDYLPGDTIKVGVNNGSQVVYADVVLQEKVEEKK